jgi:hypothetical protein
MNQLLQEKRDAENFLRLIAPKYAAVYILDRSTDTFRDILAPEAFRAFAKDTKGLYSDAMQLYRDHYVACDYQEVIDRVLDYDYVYNILSSGNQVNVTYRKKDGTLIRLKIDRYSDNDENTSIWVYTNEDSEDALYGELGEARYRIRFDDNERPVEFIGSESLSEMLYGFKGETHISYSMLWNHMHPQDIDVVKEEFKNIHDTRDSTATYEVEYRLQNKDKHFSRISKFSPSLIIKQLEINSSKNRTCSFPAYGSPLLLLNILVIYDFVTAPNINMDIRVNDSVIPYIIEPFQFKTSSLTPSV